MTGKAGITPRKIPHLWSKFRWLVRAYYLGATALKKQVWTTKVTQPMTIASPGCAELNWVGRSNS